MANIIEIKNLVKSYGELKAVDDISFVTKENQTFAFLGSNGAGKSTTINIICGILSRDSGSVLIDGVDIDDSKNLAKNKIGIVFQNSVLDKKLSVLDNLKNKALLYGMSTIEFDKKLDYLSNELDFKDLLNKQLDKLSGGQARRIDIARALIHSPKILILDEPTTGLDPQTRQIVWNFLNKQKKEIGLTIFLTTHYMEEASDADYVVILNKGKIVAEDTPVNLKNKYTNNYIKIYTKDNNKKIGTFFSKLKFETEIEKEYVLIKVDKSINIRDLIIANPDVFEDFEIIKGKMDDVFINVTGEKIKEN